MSRSALGPACFDSEAALSLLGGGGGWLEGNQRAFKSWP
jgi:hypothetical protein